MARLVGFSSFVFGWRTEMEDGTSSCLCIEHGRIWVNSDSSEIEAICIPATRYGRVVAVRHLGVILACVNKQLKLLGGHIKKTSITQLLRKSRAATTMFGIGIVVNTAGIMEQREETHDIKITAFLSGKIQSVAFNSKPVWKAMNPVRPRWNRINHAFNKCLCDYLTLEVHLRVIEPT